MAKDPEVIDHQHWIGYVQPVGLVVSIPALIQAQAYVNRNIAPDHQRFLGCLPEDDKSPPAISDFAHFTQEVLGWEPADLIDFSGDGQDLQSLEVSLPEYNETLRPTHGVKEYEPKDPSRPWMMLIQQLPTGQNLDEVFAESDRHWQASPQNRFERLLRETQIPAGLLFNGTDLRVVYAPRGESSGYATFRVKEMAEVSGRPIFAAMHMLLEAPRLFSMAEKQRLPAILADSRKYQNVVSTQLAEQVLSALFELLRGFQAADDQRKGELLREVLADNPNQVYSGLLTVLMRLVFILYAEDRGLLSNDPVYANYYSVTGLFDRLRADAGRYPDTMNQRYGAWAQLLTLFRLIYEGGSHAEFNLPARKGYVFDPDRYAFLEGRAWKSLRQPEEKFDVPRVADGVIFHVLSNLLILDGERLSYRTLDVEQIGSVYEAMMGFELEVAKGRSIAVKPVKSHGAPTTINLEELLAAKPTDRTKWLSERTDQKITGQAAEALKQADTVDDLLAALEKKIALEVTPNTVPKGAMIFQPSDERRRSGSHYTPRILTEPIVRKTLEPILKRLGDSPTPTEILDLKICDPAMGSGAFLVEACRQLGDVLVKAWHFHNEVPRIPPDEDEILHARRLIAQRCLYGVDKNAMAVDLAKLSLWLATLAKDHPFTFLDHALRHGDSLVGLTRKQIAEFHWLPTPQRSFGQEIIEQRIKAATGVRREIIEAGDEVPFLLKQQKLALADESLNLVRFAGNLVIAAFFAGDNDKKRKAKREELLQQFSEYLRTGNMALRPTKAEQNLRSGTKGIHPFHWEIEFPEVFDRESAGFDAIVGNPPFVAGKSISGAYGTTYLDWLHSRWPECRGQVDLVVFFFRKSYDALRNKGAFGLLSTKTIAQGDCRHGGLRVIRQAGGIIYDVVRRIPWQGAAAVTTSVIHVAKCFSPRSLILDGAVVPDITAFLVDKGGDDDPGRLTTNQELAFSGYYYYGPGFLFDNTTDGASSLAEMNRILSASPRSRQRIHPIIGGDDILDRPIVEQKRFVIDFEDMTEEEAKKWPDLYEVLNRLVRPERQQCNRDRLRTHWWQFGEVRPGLRRASVGLRQVLMHPFPSKYLSFAFIPSEVYIASPHVAITLDHYAAFCALQSQCHETWVRFFASTMEDRLRYTLSDCFETFPFPPSVLEYVADGTSPTNDRYLTILETAGREYYEFRAALMIRNDEGLTKTYNHFHDPYETSSDIKKLRELHAAMDRAVLDAYGWTDLTPTCEFLLDYDEEEEGDSEDRPAGRGRKKPWRYRWPDEFRDTVLARLLELNKERAEQERLSGQAAAAKEIGKSKARGKSKKSLTNNSDDATLFDK